MGTNKGNVVTFQMEVTLSYDEELGTWWLSGIKPPADAPEIAGLSRPVYEVRDGRLVARLYQYEPPAPAGEEVQTEATDPTSY